ncbi:MAG: hypothetical protein ACI8WM_000774 [Burkholderiaceae bacterium]
MLLDRASTARRKAVRSLLEKSRGINCHSDFASLRKFPEPSDVASEIAWIHDLKTMLIMSNLLNVGGLIPDMLMTLTTL